MSLWTGLHRNSASEWPSCYHRATASVWQAARCLTLSLPPFKVLPPIRCPMWKSELFNRSSLVKSVKVELPVGHSWQRFQSGLSVSYLLLSLHLVFAHSSACYCREELTDSGFLLGPIIIQTFSRNVDVTSCLFQDPVLLLFFFFLLTISLTSRHLVFLSSLSLSLQSEHWGELGDIQIQAKKKAESFSLVTPDLYSRLALHIWDAQTFHRFKKLPKTRFFSLVFKMSWIVGHFVWVDDVLLFICCPIFFISITCVALWSSTVILICTLSINCDVTSNKKLYQVSYITWYFTIFHLKAPHPSVTPRCTSCFVTFAAFF